MGIRPWLADDGGVGMNESVRKFVKQQKVLVGIGVVLVVFALLYAWDARQLAPMFSNIGTGALMAAIAIGVVLTFRGSGVVNFANGVITVFVAY